MSEQPYPVAPDGRLHYCDPPFEGHSFVLANGSTVPVAVSDGYQSWLVAAGATQGAGLPSGVRSYQVQSVGVGQGPVTLYARDTLDPGVGLAQPISGSISAAVTNAINATVSGNVGVVIAAGNSAIIAVPGGGAQDFTLPADSDGVDIFLVGESAAGANVLTLTVILPDATSWVELQSVALGANMLRGLLYSFDRDFLTGTKFRVANENPSGAQSFTVELMY
jgi:hypothetical protein